MNELSGGDPFLEEEYYSWNWIRFLNELAFRKEKNRVS